MYVLVPQPISKINPLDHNRRPLVTFDKGDSLEHIFDITMAPVLALDGGDGSDVCAFLANQTNTYFEWKHTASAKSMDLRGEDDQQEAQNEQRVEGRVGHVRFVVCVFSKALLYVICRALECDRR